MPRVVDQNAEKINVVHRAQRRCRNGRLGTVVESDGFQTRTGYSGTAGHEGFLRQDELRVVAETRPVARDKVQGHGRPWIRQ